MTQRLVDLIWQLRNVGLSNKELASLEDLLEKKLQEVRRHMGENY